MKLPATTAHFAAACVLVMLAAPGEARAYFDPGTGSMLLQALAAGLMALAVLWGRIRNMLRSLFTHKKDRA